MTTHTGTYAAPHTEATEALTAAIHPHLITLASTEGERAYLLRRQDGRIEALGPLPKQLWLDEHEQPRQALAAGELAALGMDWQPVADPAALEALDLLPVGVWYVRQDGPDGARYVTHLHGYQDALHAFLAGMEGQDMPPALGYVALYPDGRWETGAEATSQPVVLALGSGAGLARRLASELEDVLYDRTWPR